MSCEKDCVYFQALSTEDMLLNRKARKATLESEEVPGLAGSMCGSCVQINKNTACLDEIRKSRE